MDGLTLSALHQWLQPVDALPLECDGAARVISMLLHREGVEHAIEIGTLAVAGVGEIPLHWWIRLGRSFDGTIIDYRARMWLGDDPRVPHGVVARGQDSYYQARGHGPVPDSLHPVLFLILAGIAIDDFPSPR